MQQTTWHRTAAALTGGLEGQLHDAGVHVRRSQVEHSKHVLPARLDAGGLGVDHLSHTPHHHVSDRDRPAGESTGSALERERQASIARVRCVYT